MLSGSNWDSGNGLIQKANSFLLGVCLTRGPSNWKSFGGSRTVIDSERDAPELAPTSDDVWVRYVLDFHVGYTSTCDLEEKGNRQPS